MDMDMETETETDRQTNRSVKKTRELKQTA